MLMLALVFHTLAVPADPTGLDADVHAYAKPCGEYLSGTGRAGSARSAPTRRAPREADQEGGDEGGVDVVAHGVGDGQAQGVLVRAAVVVSPAMPEAGTRVPAWASPGGLERGRRRQEPVLDLRGQADPSGAVAPVVEIGGAAVGDDYVRQ
jgi:hypothetical protein